MSNNCVTNRMVEKPVIDVTVEKVCEWELPDLVHLYGKIGADIIGVDLRKTYVAKNFSGAIIGAVTVEDAGPKMAVIRIGGVDPDFRRSKVGTQLIGVVAEELEKQGYGCLVVAHQNKSKEFLGYLGFVERDPAQMELKLKG